MAVNRYPLSAPVVLIEVTATAVCQRLLISDYHPSQSAGRTTRVDDPSVLQAALASTAVISNLNLRLNMGAYTWTDLST